MPDRGRLSIGLLAVLTVVASGCGSTTLTSTSTSTTVNTTAGTSAPAGASAQTATQSTSSTVAQKPANVTGQEKAAEVKRTGQAQASKPSAPATKPSTQSAEQRVPPTRRFGSAVRRRFTASCTADRGSSSSCECLIVKYELKNVEKVQGLAELAVIEYSLLHSEPGEHLPLRFQRVVEECKGPRT
jgi:hypothetical protein